MKKSTKPVSPGKAASKPAAGNPGRHPKGFPVVGIGASAGGLEALELFLSAVPDNSGLAYVVVQHLDPTQKGVMAELLQRLTRMPVAQAKDRMQIQPDHVYVIPPNKNISIIHGKLHLFVPVEARGLRLPIDFFFRSLAEDQGKSGIGVILSGMGSDGMLGLRAIKEKGGAGFAQDPATAKFDSMPRSSIDAGLADVVAQAGELPEKILSFLHNPRLPAEASVILDTKSQSSLEKVYILLRSRTGQDFSQYKKSTIYRRIERRMGLHRIDKIATYVRYLQETPQEAELLSKELLIGVTSFFRDPATWEQLKTECLPALFSAYPGGGVLRAWATGCSTGEEAYSLAIVFQEALDLIQPSGQFALQIFATDLDTDAIAKARSGLYPPNISADVSPERLRRFFAQGENGFRVCKEIRDSVVFAPQNLIMEAPFTKLDILICRNLLIYLEPVLQKKLLPLFHYSLKPGGILFLGSSETIGAFTDLFAPTDGKTRLYRRLDSKNRKQIIEFPSAFSRAAPEKSAAASGDHAAKIPGPSLQATMDRVLLQEYCPAAVLTNSEGDILYINGHTGKYLEPAAGKANLNIFAMAREGLSSELSSAFTLALRQNGPVGLAGVRLGVNGKTQVIDLVVKPLGELASLKNIVLVVFKDVTELAVTALSKPTPRTKAGQEAISKIQGELQLAREELQLTREEMNASQEELKSTNEELQSTNEELQSTNEELTTSKEELQSMNEELQTVNIEMQSKMDELSHSNNDLKNLLNSTDIATLFLDEELNVRRFTPQTVKVVKLIASDVGRPVSDIVTDLIYPDMTLDAQGVLATLAFVEKPVITRDGRWFLVRIMPYRTIDNRIDGLVMTFADISVAKQLEESLRQNERRMQDLFMNMPSAFALIEPVLGAAGNHEGSRFVFVNKAFEGLAGVRSRDIQGRTMREKFPKADTSLVEGLARTLETGTEQSFAARFEPDGQLVACKTYLPGESPNRICFMCEKISG
ncbi:MAG: PAS domain-containing protein [Desulfovibrionaceae bacterium]|nr:PAS domain-containing protein [Desulfovibrionaceae bacterium]MBF0514432.1 PAS domain-containing protein [Desulfovibrionaceae bacterium]